MDRMNRMSEEEMERLEACFSDSHILSILFILSIPFS